MNTATLDDLVRRVVESLPSGVREMKEEVERNARAALNARLTDLDLVTREAFEVQAKVLARTREKVDALERQVAELEARLSPPGG